MQIYNQNVFLFIQKAEALLKQIIRNETDLSLQKTRFLFQNYYYPIHIVVFEGSQKIAYFDSESYQIGMNESLLYEAREHVLKDILRHELAHYITYIQHGLTKKAHGEEFLQICARYKWGHCISKASMNLTSYKEDKVGNLQDEKVLEKVKKLFQLASSGNKNEAELATLKANQLLIRHNLKFIENNDEENYYITSLYKSKRRNNKMMAMYDILKFFYVSPILRYKNSGVELEVCGSKLNLELAEYVVSFLDQQMNLLWKDFQKEFPEAKGLKAKNSFFLGIAKGYEEKMLQAKKQFSSSDSQALTLYEKDLELAVKKIYRRIGTSSRQSELNELAHSSGKKAGKDMSIQQTIKNKTKSILSLGWSK